MSRMPFQVAAIVLVSLALFFVWDLSQRVVTNIRLAQMEQQLETDVARARASQTALEQKKKDVQSPAYPEAEMRTRGWAKAGETVAVTLKTPAATAPAHASPTPTPTPSPEKTFWQNLFDLFIGP